ncbi:hypothetical protein M426DRAFT_324915 [Hypoxylon sp. CI-4A]|nr:hypothetical protein M426DRAFT_324915 [Hypoxylon sp. CI-4A]
MNRTLPNSLGIPPAKANGNTNHTNGNSRGGTISTQPFGNRRVPKRNNGRAESNGNALDTDTSPNIGSRHPLYSSPKYIPNTNSLGASANKNSESPRESRIPQPTTTTPFSASPHELNKKGRGQIRSLSMRQPLSLKSAFARAERQETDDACDFKDSFRMATAEMDGRIDGSPSPAPRSAHLRRQSQGAIPQRTLADGANSGIGKHLRQFDRNHQLGTGNGPLAGLFGKTRIGPNMSETGNVLAERASNGDSKGSPIRRRNSQRGIDLIKDNNVDVSIPIPSIEYEPASNDNDNDNRDFPTNRSAHPSPEKSFNWELDADFTAGDLQISESPRIRTTQSNGGPQQQSSATNSPVSGTPNMRRSNNRLDQIRQKEMEVANAVLPEEDLSATKRTNNRLEELRARELEALSKRSVASSRLDEIRVRNSEARSESPEAGRRSSREGLNGGLLQPEHESAKTPEGKTRLQPKSETPLDTPPTAIRSDSDQKFGDTSKDNRDEIKAEDSKKNASLPRNDSHDLLRRLARATSDSPPTEKPEQRVVPDDLLTEAESESREGSRSRSSWEERRSRHLEVKGVDAKSNSRERPVVGFVGLPRDPSADRIRKKQTSRAGSEADPTDRIEAEMNLFAPLDSYSEKGSIRAPSPVSEPAEEETLRANKINPLTQSTPRVTGAYVETPATIKVKQENYLDDEKITDVPDNALDLKALDTVHESRSRSTSGPVNGDPVKLEENADAKPFKKASMPRSSSMPTTSAHARSTSRRRRPARQLINTAKPPSVKDDIRTILKMNQIDDSTLEDFDSILADQEIDDEELKQMVDDTIDKIDNDLDLSELSERDRELQIYDRMSKTLRTGLLGIQSAKKGIERLEDKVTHTEHKADQVRTDLKASSAKPEMPLPASSSDSPLIVATIPALYRRSHKLRPTKLGVLALTTLIWYILESIFCTMYTTPYNCTREYPCEWSPNEPYFPYAMPFMLDEWATGGKGRALVWKTGEEIGDVLADVTDWATGADFTQNDEQFMNVWERKRHRRRLRKRNLIQKWVPTPDYKTEFDQWNDASLVTEADEYEEEESVYGSEDETMNADEPIVEEDAPATNIGGFRSWLHIF